MPYALALTALMMGLVGGASHCIAMCGAPCAGIGYSATGGALRQGLAVLLFHAGRLLGYSTLGALAAASMQALGWMSVHSAALRPLWTMVHIAALLLGLLLLLQARQPAWLQRSARSLWQRVQRMQVHGGVFAPLFIGVLWALLPCGLLYSALMVAALAAELWQGAIVMALFAAGTSLALTASTCLLLRFAHLRHMGDGQWGVRLAGLALAVSAAFALWMGLVHQQAPWCAT